MAGKNITIAGATFNGVPSIDVPVSGGGTASYVEISDTTAQAADVASGKYFYDAAGVKTEGTASGGGGGASNVVTGTFKGTAEGAIEITLPYEGTGYPIAATVFPKEGPYNAADGDFYNLIQRRAFAVYNCVKSDANAAPTYTGSGAENQVCQMYRYKSNSSTATSYSVTGETKILYSDSAAVTTSPFRFRAKDKLSVYAGSSTSFNIFAQDIEYAYQIIYSE